MTDARRVFDELASALGEITAPWLDSFGASCLVVGGSISQAWDLLGRPARRARGRRRPRGDRPAERVDDAALLGAARHAAATVARRAASEHGSERPRLAEMTVDEARRPRPRSARRARSTLVSNARARRQRADQALRPARLGSPPPCAWFPGGGWVLDTGHPAPALSYVAAEAPCCVRGRAVPACAGAPFPAPLDDCVEALRWLVAEAAQLGIDPARIAGRHQRWPISPRRSHSSAATAAARVRLQVLVYPALLYGSDTESMRSDFPSFDGRDVEWCWSHYLAHADDGENALASPLLAELRGLPPALIVTAEHDPLRDEGELYAEKLRRSGVDVEVVRIAGAAHGFFSGTDERTMPRGSSPRRSVACVRRRAGMIDHRPSFPEGPCPVSASSGAGRS